MKRMQALALALFACACLTGCETTGADRALGPPTPAGVDVHIRAEQSGLTVPVRIGQELAIELVGVPTAGYLWMVSEAPGFLTGGGQASGPTIAAQKQPGYTGGRHWEVFLYTVKARGTGVLKLVQRRPWEANEPPTDTFNVTITAN